MNLEVAHHKGDDSSNDASGNIVGTRCIDNGVVNIELEVSLRPRFGGDLHDSPSGTRASGNTAGRDQNAREDSFESGRRRARASATRLSSRASAPRERGT